ncbi:MAG: PKD domain-containing protein [Bacteroidales bacterium]|nr:PKD domain-containing protein [Bacteroidales bacterium]
MTKTIFALLLLLVCGIGASAEVKTWTHKWDTSKANGGEGFYHISDNSETTQTTMLKKLEWTYSGNTSVTAYTASAGQYFGSAKSPVTHATLSTSKMQGKIISVKIETKVKDAAQAVAIGVKVNGVAYGTDINPTTEKAEYTFAPAGEAQEGEIVITMDQTSETKGIIYFFSMTIEYDGEGPLKPEPKEAGLSYPLQEVTVECGDNASANYLDNPNKLSPITYTCSDADLAAVNSNGAIFTTGRKTGSATITASFAGNDDFKAGSASYTLTVIEKPVIAAPTISPAGGTFTEPVTVTITSEDPLCKAIWYSTELTSVDDMGYDEKTIIVPGNVATVTIDSTCTLLAVAVGDNNIGLPAQQTFTMNIPLSADFGAEESSMAYYSQGWDSVEEASTWKYYGINNSTWTLSGNAPFSDVPQFTSIDPSSKYSLTIYYDQAAQRERAVSPEIDIKDNSKAEFYLCFSGVWLYAADLKFVVNDLTAGTQTQLFSAFSWAQDNAFDGPSWEKFSFDLAQFAGHKCSFEFIYEGTYGDNMAIDNFVVKREDTSADAKINIFEGESVHFKDQSKGHPTAWEWTIDGVTPSVYTEKNPVVKFDKAGKYTVKLVVKKGTETAEATKEQYVVVNVAAPKAHIGVPAGAYYSPYAYAFVPTNVALQYRDLSTGSPTSWKWTFQGTDVAESTDQNPTVTYLAPGKYGLELVVENTAGSARDFLVDAIQAGATQEVWNIAPDEIENIGTISLGYYGDYAGTNWVGMEAFAERYQKPLVAAQVEGVSLYFDNVTYENGDTDFSVKVCLPDANGMPGEVLATATKKVSELAVDADEVVATDFKFAAPVNIDSDFFVVVSGFPKGNWDRVNLLCMARGENERNTAYHLLEDEDENYQPLGTYTWFESTDQPLSICIAPQVTYVNQEPTGITDVTADSKKDGIYDVLGRKLAAPQKGFNIIGGKKVIVK